MKLSLAALLLASVASLPCAAARIGHKAFKQSSEKPIDPHKAHLAPVPTLQDTTEHRIVGGEAAEPGDFPFYVNLPDGFGGFCGGSLIHEDIILTAAHCYDVIADSVIIGAYFLESVDANAETGIVETREIHPDYSEETMVNDVMVVKITSPSLLPTISLNDDSNSPSVGENVIAIGLGVTDVTTETVADGLRKVAVPIIAYDECAADYDGVFAGANIVEDVMLCAGFKEGGKDSCQGDSGGPLLELRDGEYVQVGITSWGNGCAEPNAPGIYTRVSGVKDWIDQMICELSENPPASCGTTPDAPTPKPTEGEQCEDVPGWYDSAGLEYDCAWYEEYDACEYASEYENDGYTATEACCICGGRNGGNGDGPTPTPPPTSPTGGAKCEDVPGWYDPDGPEYDCAWYEEYDACWIASVYENGGYTAAEACCFCGGGNA